MAQQSISQIRTVVAYNGEELAMKQYEKALEDPVKVSSAEKAGGSLGEGESEGMKTIGL